jgi:hypothetical protein
MQPGISGRKSASWELTKLPVIPSGSAGTKPDADALYAGAFNQAATVVGATSVTYSFSDLGVQPFTLASFFHAQSTLTKRLIYGCCVTDVEWQLNGNVLDQTFKGTGVYRVDSDNFGSETSDVLGGLGSFPAEPSSPSTVGTIIPGFGGIATIDGTDMGLQLRSCTILLKTGNRLMGDLFGSALPHIQVGGQREVSISLGFVDNDSTALVAIKNLAKQYGTTDMTITVGTVGGLKVKWTIKSVQLVVPDMADQADFVETSFGSSMAHASAIANVDDVTLAFL